VVAVTPATCVVRFGVFDFDPKAGQLNRNGMRVRLSQQPRQVLCVLLDRPGEIVTREELRRLLWSADVFVDFDHGLNKSIQKIREALGDSPESPRYVETIPRIGYRFIAPVIGKTAPLSLAPPDEIVSVTAVEAPTDPGGERHVTSMWKWYAFGGCAAIVMVVAFWIIERQRQVIDPIRSLAVIPLDNLSGDPGQEYFADGMTDELITMLAKNSTLRIVSRTSVMQYKGAHRPLREIANALGVDGVLEGSISRSGDRVHMTIQLIRADTDAHVWAESYDRTTDTAVSLSRDAALTIAKRLKRAAARPIPHYVNPEAHDAYIHGRYLWNAGQYDKASESFKKATALQPDYAPGWSGMSMYYVASAATGNMNPLEALPLGEAAAIKAVQLDDLSPEAHMVLGGTVLVSRWDWTRAERESIRCIELDPEYFEGYHLRARIFAALNRYAEAIEAEKKAAELDPFARPSALAHYYRSARQYDAALREALQRLEATPNDASLNFALFDIYRCKGMGKEAAEFLEKGLLLAGEKNSAEGVRRAFQKDGYKGLVAWQIDHLEKRSTSHYVSPADLAGWYAQLGEREKTLSLLEEGYGQHTPQLLYIQSDPAYDFLHTDLRYRSLIQRIGLPPAY
jgi:TolB-like protein/DNA-binding winged helix-turn-helix (wHTH) protein